jgi:transposase
MARPTKLTPEVQARIVDAIRAGNTREAAARFAQVSERVVYLWLRKGERARNGSPCGLLFQAVMEAENAAETEAVAIIRLAMRHKWQAAAWWLERRRHEVWGRRESVEVTVRRVAEQRAKERGLDPEEVVKRAEEIMGLR